MRQTLRRHRRPSEAARDAGGDIEPPSGGPLTAQRLQRALPAVIAAAIIAGAVLHLAGAPAAGDVLWTATIAIVLVPLTASVARSLMRRDVGVDAIALLAMAGCLALGELLAGVIVALMLAGGNALELAAGRRARHALEQLLARAPGHAHRRVGGVIEELPVEAIVPGDVVLVRAGEIVPVDGVVAAGRAVLDESTLTGEPMPVRIGPGEPVRSGAANAAETFDLRATRPAVDSTYAAIVRLVRSAEAERAPFVRMADRYAAFLLPLTLCVAGAAWALSGDPVRALAVLVVATPCPLILAAPIALVSGVSRAARLGIVVKGPAVLERLARGRSVLLDKTGTITLGAPFIDHVVAFDGASEDEIVRLAASVDQLSAHAMAEALVADARRRALALESPEDVVERAGDGIEGVVAGHKVVLGSRGFLRDRGVAFDAPNGAIPNGRGRILVGLDGALAGAIIMVDRPRADARSAVRRLRAAGLVRVVMITGDDRVAAEQIARQVGIEEVVSECLPKDKVGAVRALQADPVTQPVIMVGDGINDAPALAAADVGIAIAATAGATVSSETADLVIIVDRLDRVADAVGIARKTLAIARQSVQLGMSLSLVAMVVAAFGYLPPVAGALLQEAIDVGAILSALRAMRA